MPADLIEQTATDPVPWTRGQLRAEIMGALLVATDHCPGCDFCGREVDALMTVFDQALRAVASKVHERESARLQVIRRQRATIEQLQRTAELADVTGPQHTRLVDLMESEVRVRVTNPSKPGLAWSGRIAAMADHPVCCVLSEDGRHHHLPQAFDYQEA